MAERRGGSYSVARTMITYLLVFAGSTLLFAWGFAYVQCRHASEGYEDEQGFHFGPDPRSPDCGDYVLQPVPVETDTRVGAARRD